MLVDVKSAKGAPGPSANPYGVAEEPRPSRKPFMLAAVLSSVMLYLSSLWASEKPAAAPAAPEEGDDALPPPAADEVQVALADERPGSQSQGRNPTEQGFAEDGTIRFGSAGTIVQLQPAAVFQTIHSPEIRLPITIATELRLPDFRGVQWQAAAANDNMPGPGLGGPILPPPRTPPTEPPVQPNRAPRLSGPVLLSDTLICVTLSLAMTDLLHGASDPDGDRLVIRDLTVSSGTLTRTASGWVYDPAEIGPVTLTYKVSDGSAFVTQVARFDVVAHSPIEGTEGDDRLLGSNCGEDIDGRAGNDIIDARGGNDTIFGGDGDDHIVAGDGNDVVHAGRGDDVVFGGRGNDWLQGGDGNDRLFGEDGDDVLRGDEGNDLLSGGNGSDLLFGGDGNDHVAGDAGDDRLAGEAGHDVLQGGAGSDIVDAGEGDDHVIGDADGTADSYVGGEGHDLLDYAQATDGIVFDLPNGQASSEEIGDDMIAGFESYAGGSGNDHFIADAMPATFMGRAGDDLFEFRAPALTHGQIIAYEIFDFMIGDRIRISRYDLFEEVMDSLEDRFEDIYGDDIDDDDLPIRITNARSDDVRTTLIEADLNGDDIYELAISLNGEHQITITEIA